MTAMAPLNPLRTRVGYHSLSEILVRALHMGFTLTPEIAAFMGTIAGIISTIIGMIITLRKVEVDRQANAAKAKAEGEAKKIQVEAEAEARAAEAQQTVSRTTIELLAPLRKELYDTRKDLEGTQNELRMYRLQTERMGAQLDAANARYEQLKCQFEQLKLDYASMVDGANLLVKQVKDAGLTPIWLPKRNGN